MIPGTINTKICVVINDRVSGFHPKSLEKAFHGHSPEHQFDSPDASLGRDDSPFRKRIKLERLATLPQQLGRGQQIVRAVLPCDRLVSATVHQSDQFGIHSCLAPRTTSPRNDTEMRKTFAATLFYPAIDQLAPFSPSFPPRPARVSSRSHRAILCASTRDTRYRSAPSAWL